MIEVSSAAFFFDTVKSPVGVFCGRMRASMDESPSRNDSATTGDFSARKATQFLFVRLVASLLAVELAFTLALLAGAGLMTRSFMSLYRADLVIDATTVLSTRIVLPPARYPTPDAQTAFFRQLEEQLGGLSPIGAAAFANTVPTLHPILLERPLD